MDLGGTSTWMCEGTIPRKKSVESSREQRPRTMQEAIVESNAGRLHGSKWYDSTEGIGRVESGTETEDDSGDKVEQFYRAVVEER